MISKYNKFILEKVLNESTLYVSPELLKKLQGIKSEISTDLMYQIGKDVKPDVTFLDENENGELTFITMRNALNKLKDKYGPSMLNDIKEPSSFRFATNLARVLRNNERDFWKQSRNPIKIGRLIKQIFPGKYSDADIEKFVNLFKSEVEVVNEKFILVEGKDIEKYYWHENYKENAGDLGRSCMARKKKFFNIYVQNPEVCRLLVLLEDDKVIGRALVWKIDQNNRYNEIEYFMDRQYTIEQSDVNKFVKYAKENNWAYKTYNNHHSYSNITFKGEEMNCDMVVKVELKDYDSYPYMDTFKRYNPKNGKLYNDMEKHDNGGQYILDDTDGYYTLISESKWSDYYDCEIPEEDAEWSEGLHDWIWRENAAWISPGRGRRHDGYYPEDYDDIIYSEWEDGYLHKDDCIWCEEYDEYILEINSIIGVYKLNPNNFDIETTYYHKDDNDLFILYSKDSTWYKVLCDKNDDWKSVDAIKSDLLTSKNHPKVYNVFVYKTKDDVYLTPRDAKILGMEYDKDEKDELNDFEYHLRLKEAGLLSVLLDKLINELIPNTERIADEGEEDMLQMYIDRRDRIWERMPNNYNGE